MFDRLFSHFLNTVRDFQPGLKWISRWLFDDFILSEVVDPVSKAPYLLRVAESLQYTSPFRANVPCLWPQKGSFIFAFRVYGETTVDWNELILWLQLDSNPEPLSS